MTDTATPTPSGDLAALRRDVDKFLAELDRRDIEAAHVENATEFLKDRSSTLTMVLGQVVKIMLGRDHDLFKHLYPNPVGPYPNMASKVMSFNRPERRWTQFGTKAELLAMLRKAGVKRLSGAPRSMLVRLAWDHRLIPGSVAIRRNGDKVA